MNTSPPWIGADEAARLLGVTRATLYAYVSRGYVRSQTTPGATRERAYAREDLDRLRRRTEERRAPDTATARALQWGLPVLESSLTLIDGHRLYYRGHDAVELARLRPFEDVAALTWTGQFDSPIASPVTNDVAVALPRAPFVARAQTMLAAAASGDPLAFDVRPARVRFTGWRIVHLLAKAATRSDIRGATVDVALARAWGVAGRGIDVLRAALILCADHELNVSSFTARCVASAGSHPYAVVTAALAALEGPKHGGAGARVEAMLESMRRARPLSRAVSERVRRGESIEGFGHPLYPGGDPRAAALMDVLAEGYPKSPERTYVADVAAAVTSATRERPNVDFGLAAVSRTLRLPPESSLALFAIGRSIGWIGHAIEQYATGQLIRPRARYVGVGAK